MYDVEGLMVQAVNANVQTPEELLQALPTLKPMAADLRVPLGHDGHFSNQGHDALNALNAMERFDWDRLYHLPTFHKRGSAEAAVAAGVKAQGSTTPISEPGGPMLPSGDMIAEC